MSGGKDGERWSHRIVRTAETELACASGEVREAVPGPAATRESVSPTCLSSMGNTRVASLTNVFRQSLRCETMSSKCKHHGGKMYDFHRGSSLSSELVCLVLYLLVRLIVLLRLWLVLVVDVAHRRLEVVHAADNTAAGILRLGVEVHGHIVVCRRVHARLLVVALLHGVRVLPPLPRDAARHLLLGRSAAEERRLLLLLLGSDLVLRPLAGGARAAQGRFERCCCAAIRHAPLLFLLVVRRRRATRTRNGLSLGRCRQRGRCQYLLHLVHFFSGFSRLLIDLHVPHVHVPVAFVLLFLLLQRLLFVNHEPIHGAPGVQVGEGYGLAAVDADGGKLVRVFLDEVPHRWVQNLRLDGKPETPPLLAHRRHPHANAGAQGQRVAHLGPVLLRDGDEHVGLASAVH
mmetsp:Transcript_14526/g.23904  ORF Transcript_14526/g.23904 Transcript_14526/m.23904 type:complete len:403 (+) Transcript_14526:1463-2671(+)